MDTFERTEDLRRFVAEHRKQGHKIGLVPTMGYLHEGHYSLIRACRRECGAVVVSIFVNPAQFGPREDLGRYPRDLEGDLRGCREEGVDAVFNPSVEEVYPPGFQTYVAVENITRRYCGAARPVHFRGVATVVAKLLNMIQPDVAYFGEKDFQQSVVIKRMVKDLNISVEISVQPTVREADGLAMSSRNRYLSGEERQAATALNRSIEEARGLVASGERRPDFILDSVRRVIEKEPLVRLEYAAITDNETLEPVGEIVGREHLLLAAHVGSARLIDNSSFGGVV